MIERPSPKEKRVSLFVTCMVDMLSPQTGMSVVDVLEYLGVEVEFPAGQTCCGQPAFNSGYRRETRQVARHFLKVFHDAEVIVAPSGSCTAMIRHEYPRLFADDPDTQAEAERLASITWEFTEFIVDGLGITDLNAALPEPRTVAVHHACHGLRLLGLGQGTEQLLTHMGNANIVDWDSGELCCGFGGLFSVKMADVSGAILQKKLRDIGDSGADWIVTGDISCLTHMNGGLVKQGQQPSVRHVADVLAEGIRGQQ
ncbi:MAG: (Fe-S)-binding protein [Chloroflexota bacterium]